MRAYVLIQTMITQKNGKAMPSVAASLIERLPDDGDPRRPMEEILAQDVLFAAYVGTWWYTCAILDVSFIVLI